jgi:hypothetical protein
MTTKNDRNDEKVTATATAKSSDNREEQRR